MNVILKRIQKFCMMRSSVIYKEYIFRQVFFNFISELINFKIKQPKSLSNIYMPIKASELIAQIAEKFQTWVRLVHSIFDFLLQIHIQVTFLNSVSSRYIIFFPFTIDFILIKQTSFLGNLGIKRLISGFFLVVLFHDTPGLHMAFLIDRNRGRVQSILISNT